MGNYIKNIKNIKKAELITRPFFILKLSKIKP